MSTNKTTIIEAILGMDYQDLHDYATKRVGSQDADDIVQETYLHFLQRNDKGIIREPRAFLFKIAGNLSIDAWRKTKRHSECAAVDSELDLDELPSPMPGPASTTDGIQQFEAFLALLDELPEIQRHTFILNKMEGYSHALIAERLGISTKSVQRHLIAAMEHFAAKLDVPTF